MIASRSAAAAAGALMTLSACNQTGAPASPASAPSPTAAPAPAPPPRPPAEQVLAVYNWADFIGKDTIKEFERATGITVIYDTYDAEMTVEAKLLAGDAGYDVVFPSMDYVVRQLKAGVYAPLDKSRLPNWSNLDRHVLEVFDRIDPGNEHAVPYLHSVTGFVYNVDLVRKRMSDAPVDSLDMLFKPAVIA